MLRVGLCIAGGCMTAGIAISIVRTDILLAVLCGVALGAIFMAANAPSRS